MHTKSKFDVKLLWPKLDHSSRVTPEGLVLGGECARLGVYNLRAVPHLQIVFGVTPMRDCLTRHQEVLEEVHTSKFKNRTLDAS